MILRALVLVLAAAGVAAAAADLVLVNGPIHTLVDDRASTVEALAVADGAVIAAGDRDDVEQHVGPGTRTIDLQGRAVVPGLVDAHAHLQNLGETLVQVDLRGTSSADECVERGRAMAEDLADGAWLRGRGWDQNDWENTAFPTRTILDEAFGDRPVVFERVDGHAIWVNTAAIRAGGIDATTPDPDGGEIVRAADGTPTGVLIDEAEDLVLLHAPEPDAAEIERRYRSAVEECVRLGITGVHEMGVDLDALAALRKGEDEGWLDLRVVAYLSGAETLAAYEGSRAGLEPSARVRVEGVKLYADGALGSRGAALIEDYSDRPGHRGLLIRDPATLQRQIERVFTRHMGVAIHAIGDRANRIVLDRIIAAHEVVDEREYDVPPLRDLRARIEHAQIVHPDDIERFAEHGILPSMQPTHCTSDMPWAPQRLGPDRLEGAYAWRRFRDLGLILPLGSDFPVEATSPWLGLYAAVTRQTPDGHPPDGWSPDQRLEPLEALLGFTAWAARAIDATAWGTLGVGQRADLIVVDRDPLAGTPSDLLDTRVLMTVVDGEIVHEVVTEGR